VADGGCSADSPSTAPDPKGLDVTASLHPGAPVYSFDNAHPESVDRHVYLSAMMDPNTFARLSSLGDLTGRRCLEVGAGGGSVARWLAEQVGPTGHVLATDLDPMHLQDGAGYSILQHDLVKDPVPDGTWDIIHARMVLIHIPERDEILARLAAALAPGGALVFEDWAVLITDDLVFDAPSEDDVELFYTYQRVLRKILDSRGNDPTWAGRVPGLMVKAGLSDVETAIEARSWRGGEAATLLVSANVAQTRQQFIDAGFTEDHIARLDKLVSDPRFLMRAHLMYSTIGRKPA
jgi:SAM-dependent methyltransferase